MNQQPPLKSYMVGDVVRMELEVMHWMNLDEVLVVWRHETVQTEELTLMSEQASSLDQVPNGEKRSFWNLDGEVKHHHRAGTYSLNRIVLFTAAEKAIVIDKEALGERPIPSIEIVAEPDTTPYFGRINVL